MFRLGDRKVSEGWDDLLLFLSPNHNDSSRGIRLVRERNLVYATTPLDGVSSYPSRFSEGASASATPDVWLETVQSEVSCAGAANPDSRRS